MAKKRKKNIPFPASFQVLELLIEKTRERATGCYISDLAHGSGLSSGTVSNFMQRQTRYPRFHTVWALAKLVGTDIQFKGLHQSLKKLSKKSA